MGQRSEIYIVFSNFPNLALHGIEFNLSEMANLLSHNKFLVSLLLTLVQIQTMVLSYQYKVGDLDSWGIPTSANPQIYTKWSKDHNLTIGDSLLFLYPPSQDSVIQVTEESYKKCNLKNPILYMNNGNSLFNITSNGVFYFTSGEAGHCQKNQKLRISVGGVGGGGENMDEAPGPSSSLPAYAPSYPTVFGNIPVAPSSSDSPHLTSISHVLITGFVICALFSALIEPLEDNLHKEKKNLEEGWSKVGLKYKLAFDMEDWIGPRLYSCCNCRNHVALHDDVISKAFQGRSGRAFLFSHAMNITVGPKEDRQLMTGLHTVADVFCSDCHEVLGWKYERAYEETQKYKEGKFILEKSKIVRENW
ncbi:hypothetical protein RJT34_23345 [Clitoria ternatea]|uniref:Uncharacterized protein n=1 Tax=Clitoria ternatea TaxID=43366 RepID=A0AAN9IEV8_CLITE